MGEQGVTIAAQADKSLAESLQHLGSLLRMVDCTIIWITLGALWIFLLTKRKGKPDWTIACFCVAMMIWSLAGLLSYLNPGEALWYRYLLSPLNSLALALSFFTFQWVRRSFSSPAYWLTFAIVSSFVAGAGAGTWYWGSEQGIGRYLDFGGSLVAALALGAGITVALWNYENRLLSVFAGIALIALVIIQFAYMLNPQIHTQPIGILVSSGSRVSLGMILSLTATAWSLSEVARLHVISSKTPVHVAVLCIDVRGSTEFHEAEENRVVVASFITDLIEETRKEAVKKMGTPAMTKFMGDGCLMVWEVDRLNDDVNRQVIDLALSLQKEYPRFKERQETEKKMRRKLPAAVGVGAATGSALRLSLENGSQDYLGKPINFAARFQGKARTKEARNGNPQPIAERGGVVVELVALLNDYRLQEFPNQATVKVGGRPVEVATTAGVLGTRPRPKYPAPLHEGT